MYTRPVIPGAASIDYRGTNSNLLLRNVTLATMNRELHVDAIFDTGATLCIIPDAFARTLGFHPGNRLETRPFDVVGGRRITMDIHRLERVVVGTARAHNVMFGVSAAGVRWSLVLLGLTFIGQFETATVNFAAKRLLLRGAR